MSYVIDQKVQAVASLMFPEQKGQKRQLTGAVIAAIGAAIVSIIQELATCFGGLATPTPAPTPATSTPTPVPHKAVSPATALSTMQAPSMLQAMRARIIVDSAFITHAPSEFAECAALAHTSILSVGASTTQDDLNTMYGEVASLGSSS